MPFVRQLASELSDHGRLQETRPKSLGFRRARDARSSMFLPTDVREAPVSRPKNTDLTVSNR